jgi:hypothetical protein
MCPAKPGREAQFPRFRSPPAKAGAGSARAEAAEHGADRPGDDQYVEPEAEILDVVEVVVELPQHILDLGDMALVDLGPAGDAGANDVPVAVEGQLRLVPSGQRHGFRAGSDPAHLAAQDVDHLWQLVDPGAAQEAADASHAIVAVAGDRFRSEVVHGAGMGHRAELDHDEWLAAITHPLLPEQDRPARIEPDDQRDDHQKRREHRQGDDAGDEVREPLDLGVDDARNQRAEIVLGQMLDRDPAGERFLHLLDVHDEPAVDCGIGQEAFPFVRYVGVEIGDDHVDHGVAVVGLGKPNPAYVRDREQVIDPAERDDTDAEPLLPLQLEVDDIIPEQAEQEADREMDAAIVEAAEEEDREHQAVTDREARQDMIGSANARIMGDAAKAVIAGDKGEGGAGERVLEAVELADLIFELIADQKGNDHREQQPDAELQPDPLPERAPRGREFASRDVHSGSGLEASGLAPALRAKRRESLAFGGSGGSLHVPFWTIARPCRPLDLRLRGLARPPRLSFASAFV